MERGIISNPCPEFMKNWQKFGVTDTNKWKIYFVTLETSHLQHKIHKILLSKIFHS